MTMGYCMVCQRLVPIKQHEQKWGSRERVWKPYAHEGADGKLCPGDKKEIR